MKLSAEEKLARLERTMSITLAVIQLRAEKELMGIDQTITRMMLKGEDPKQTFTTIVDKSIYYGELTGKRQVLATLIDWIRSDKEESALDQLIQRQTNDK